MAIELATQYLSYVDELFAAESKRSLLTNQDFAWDGAHTVKVYSVSTAAMNDYGRTGAAQGNWSRYGAVKNLDATTQSMTLSKDRSFTFAIDKLDTDETRQQVQAASALARQLREVSIPEIDAHVYARMAAGAGHRGAALVSPGQTPCGITLSRTGKDGSVRHVPLAAALRRTTVPEGVLRGCCAAITRQNAFLPKAAQRPWGGFLQTGCERKRHFPDRSVKKAPGRRCWV